MYEPVRLDPTIIYVLIPPYLAFSEDSDHGVVLVAVVFVSLASAVDVAELQASVDIAVAFDFLVLVSAVVAEADSR